MTLSGRGITLVVVCVGTSVPGGAADSVDPVSPPLQPPESRDTRERANNTFLIAPELAMPVPVCVAPAQMHEE